MNAYSVILPQELREILETNPERTVLLVAGEAREGACPNCNGAGIIGIIKLDKRYDMPIGRVKWISGVDGLQYGWYTYESEYAHCPVCRPNKESEYAMSRCGLEKGYYLHEFLTDTARTREKAAAKKAIERLLSAGRNAAGFLTLHGDYGTGKSHLLKSAVWGFATMGRRSLYITLPDLLASIQQTYDDPSLHVEDLVEEYRAIPVLAIDELDKAKLTDWARQMVFRLLDVRYERRDALLTLLALNTNPDKFELGYLASRMEGGLVIEVGGADMRAILGGF